MTRAVHPLYTHALDDAEWAKRMRLVARGDIAIVIGPASAPPASDEWHLLAPRVAQLTALGVTVFGYVPLDYGRNPISQVADHVRRWVSFGVRRIFGDECRATSSQAPAEALLLRDALYAYHPPGLASGAVLILNPGVWVGWTLPNTLVVTMEVKDEGPGLPLPFRIPKSHEVAMVHHSVDPAADRLALRSFPWVYVTTDGADGNEYDEASEG
jgi:hypothetical protein